MTSAETVLLEQQSVPEFLKLAKADETLSGRSRVIVTLSTPSRRALAKYLCLPATSVLDHLEKAFASAGVCCEVIDMSFAEAISRRLVTAESCSSGLLLPSHCPGFALYAEKTQPESTVELLSRVRSPDQIAGVLLKTVIPRLDQRMTEALRGRMNRRAEIAKTLPASIVHITISPCFDKKIEVLRENYKLESDYTGRSSVPAVDLVLTTSEVIGLLKDCPSFIQNLRNSSLVISALGLRKSWGTAGTHVAGGGYTESILSSPNSGTWQHQRNKDLSTFNSPGSRSVMLAYGFKNIQNIVRRLSDLQSTTRIVEIMACPGACDYGGGQPKVGEVSKDRNNDQIGRGGLLSRLRSIFCASEEIEKDPETLASVVHVHKGQADVVELLLSETASYFGRPVDDVFSAKWSSLIGGGGSLKW